MNKTLSFFDKIKWRYWAATFVLGIFLPFVLHITSASHVFIDLWFLIIINTLAAIILGSLIKANRAHWLLIWLFPIFFMIGAYFFLPKYGYYFVIIYLTTSYIAYGLTS
ncbi:hypothetical protein [Pediococcus damnosus]|uniref:hypothetical protein n=1 Tax=Pediococcus damnosus TaxID=51663 RepID=UPI000705007F|nr:hypothetical protein [Pediococcus damnosus]KRN50314.1 hypothetical protein IV84_GL001269 [Pediococcus damnosus]PJE48507.1 hypothetical protein BSQ36_00290 [Pediococcus damnosus]